jgi:parallel beta-helix repeat protein
MVSDCSFFNCNHALRLGRGDNAWSLTNRLATRSQAVNNYFFNCRTFAIEFFSTESCIASHNVIVGGSSSASAPCVGIRVVESSRTAILNNTISDNGRGIAFSSVNAQVGVVVRGNTVQGTTSGSSMSVGGPTENTVIEDNIFSGAGDTAAISAIGSSGGTILQTNLTFRNNALTSTTTSTHTVRFDYPTGLLFEGNRIRNANTTSNALLIQNGDGYCSVAGNYFDIASATAYAVRDIAGAASMTLDTKNNTFKLGDMSRKVIRSGGSQSIYKNADIASLRDFGAVGNGSTDDSAAVLLALNSGSKLIDGGGLTYRLNSNITVTADNFILQNAHFSLISNSSGGPAIRFSGTQASAVALTSSTSKGANTVVVSSTAGFNADDYAWIMSDVIFATGTINTKVGQIVKIKAVNGATSMTLHEDVLYSFNTADNATIAKITPKSNITFRHVSFTGANANLQEAVEFDKCVNVCCENCSFSYVDRGAIDLVRCANVVVSDTSVRYARLAGFSYGVIMQQGCYGVRIANCYGEDTRHLVTTGGSEGVNVFITVTGCHSAASRDAGFDGHAQTDFMVIDGNTVECVDDANDGIIFQGLNCVISNNIIVGNAAIGIRHQLLADIQNASCVISGNSIQNHGGTPSTDVAIYVANETKGAALGRFEKVIVANNGVHGSIDTGVYIYAKDGDINNVTVSGNIVSSEASVAACFLRADASRTMDSFSITGNTFRAGSGTNNIYILGDTSPNIVKGAISGNTLRGGNNGIRLIQSQDVVETGNYITATTRKVFVDTGASNVWLDRRFYSPVTTTSSTYTVTTENGHIICNRAETVTLTLPTASQWTGRELTVKTIQAQTVVSASSDVVPIDGSAAGTAILPATGGAWALLRSDGTNWVIMQRG